MKLDEKEIKFDLLYCMVADAKRWLRAGVLRRFNLLAAPRLESHKRWEALPPLPATVMSHGGVLTWMSQRCSTTVQRPIGADTWLTSADVVVVQDSDLAACMVRGYPCVPFPDDSCQQASQQAPDAQAGPDAQATGDPAGQICGYSRRQHQLLQTALVVLVPSDAVDLVAPLLLPVLQHPIVLISSDSDWGGDGGTLPVFSPLDTVDHRFGPTANDDKILRWFARGLTLENRYASPIPAPMPRRVTRALLQIAPHPQDAAVHARCAPSVSQAPEGEGEVSSSWPAAADELEPRPPSWLFIPNAHSLCVEEASRPAWLLEVGVECREVPLLTTIGEVDAAEEAGADGRVVGLVNAIARNRFCLLTEIEESEEYLVWLCLWVGAVPIVKPSARFQVYSLHLPIVSFRPLALWLLKANSSCLAAV